MSQALPKGRNANSLTLNNPAKPSAKTKSERTSVDETELNQKAKDVVGNKDAKDNKVNNDDKPSVKKDKVNNDDKPSAKKDKTPTVGEEAKSDSKNEEKMKNGSSNTSGESNTKISNGSHKNEENSTTEEKKTRETRPKSNTVKDNKSESVETANLGKPEKTEKSTEKPAAAQKEKEKEKEKDKDKVTTKSSQKDKKPDKEDKQPSTKDTPKTDSNDAKSTTAPKDKDSKDVLKTKMIDSPKPKSKPESTPSKSKKDEEKPEVVPAPKDNNSKPVLWDNEEMEPLLMQVDVEEKTPLKKSSLASTSTPTPTSRILRMCSGPPERNESPLSLFAIVDPKNNTSTCVNLSTLTNPHSPDKSYGAKVRSVSGRRPMLREISYQNSYREHIKQNDSYSPCTINESTSSGYLDQSQRSINTSSFVARKRYNEDYIVKEIESPKRPRLDVSGLLTLVSSPVTMLRNRLARARIQSSTPNSKSNINKDDIEIDTVTASCIGESQEYEVDEEEEEVQGEIYENDDEEMIQLPDADKFTTPPEDIEFNTDIQIKILKEENKLGSSPFVPNDAIKKKWTCSLM